MSIDLRNAPALSVYLDEVVLNATMGLGSAPMNVQIEMGEGEEVRAQLKAKRTFSAPVVDLTAFSAIPERASYTRAQLARFGLFPEAGEISTRAVARYSGEFDGTPVIAAHLARERDLAAYNVTVYPPNIEGQNPSFLTFDIPISTLFPDSADTTHENARAFVDLFNRHSAELADRLREVTETCAGAIDQAIDQRLEALRLKADLFRRLNALAKGSVTKNDH